jgi:WD40 repeat protein
MWDIEAGQVIRSLQIEEDTKVSPGLEKFRSVSCSYDGRYIIAAGHGGTVARWNALSGESEVIVKDGINATLGYVMCAELSKTNRYLVVGAIYGAFIFATRPVRLVAQFEQHRGQVNAVAISPDESFVVSASADETVRQWATESGRQIKGFYQEDLDRKDPYGNYANAVALSSDGSRILSGGSSTVTWFWNIRDNKQPLHVLRGHQSPIWTTVLSSDGIWGVTGSLTETICWNLISGKPIRILDKCTMPVLLPDEEHLLVTSPDGPSLWKIHFESQTQSMLFRV